MDNKTKFLYIANELLNRKKRATGICLEYWDDDGRHRIIIQDDEKRKDVLR